MSAPLPPLASIRVFEAAARRLNFTEAADELGMTQAAVSYQIRKLEERLGQPVFRKAGRGVALTPAGQRLSEAASEAMGALRDAFAELNQGSGVLAVTALPTLAAAWLVPRLGGFQMAHPRLAVRLDTDNRVADLALEDFDLGVRAGKGDWPGLEARFLFPSIYTPVLSPEAAEALGAAPDPARLRETPLIGDPAEWNAWFNAAGLETCEAEIAPRTAYELQQYEVTAAMAGQGAALASPILFAAEIAQGRLARPFRTVWRHPFDHWLVYPHARRMAPKVTAFRDWILAEVRADPAIREECAALGLTL